MILWTSWMNNSWLLRLFISFGHKIARNLQVIPDHEQEGTDHFQDAHYFHPTGAEKAHCAQSTSFYQQ